MSDIEEEWKPKGRPQSTMAQNLASALDSAFMLDSEVDHLSNSIQYKKQKVTIQSRELEALEARIREAEERLKLQNGAGTSSAQSSGNSHRANGTASRHDPSQLSNISENRPSAANTYNTSSDSNNGGYRGNDRFYGNARDQKENQR